MATSLPAGLERSVQATAAVVTAEGFNEGKSAANDAGEFPWARISEALDGGTCPLCAAVDGKVLRVGSPEYARWRLPSHINCRRVMVYLAAHEVEEADFEEPDAELVRKHGHFHTHPERHAQYRIPATPEGRHVVVRRVQHQETGEVRTVLDWAPWWDRVPQWKRVLVLQARATEDPGELQDILTELGITNLLDPQHLRAATLLGLRDRVEGWITFEEYTPAFLREVRAFERRNSKRRVEHGRVLSPEGKVLYRKIGTVDRLNFVQKERDQYFPGNILVHNHPRGTSFSPGDIHSACVNGLVEIRAVGQEWRYIMRPPEGGWSAEFWHRMAGRLLAYLRQLELRDAMDIRTGVRTLEECDMDLMHRVWVQMAAEFGLQYTREVNDARRRKGSPRTGRRPG
ncbi:MAG: hypothetical protein K0Q72_2808 [Armatimonadetes bacterium]|jgi:hypothetical protein|nr:hypothetical protein [Armatimonadota bacterium]